MTLLQQIQAHCKSHLEGVARIPIYIIEENHATTEHNKVEIEITNKVPVHESIPDIHRYTIEIRTEIKQESPLYPQRIAIRDRLEASTWNMIEAIPSAKDLTVPETSDGVDAKEKKYTASTTFEIICLNAEE